MVDEQNKTDLNWGDDSRVFPRLAAWLQRVTQITWLRHVEPPSITFAPFPPLLIVNLPVWWKKEEKLPDAEVPVKPVLHLRAGWRRDMNAGEFYLSFAAKIEERTKLW